MGGPAIIDGEAIYELDNFYECEFEVDGVTYCSSENYFQCCKATNDEDFDYVHSSGSGHGAWRAGNKIQIKPNWEKIKVRCMYTGNKAKISQNENIKNILCATTGEIEYTLSSHFWNKWNGWIMTLIRAELRNAGEEDLKVAQEIMGNIEQYEADMTEGVVTIDACK